VPRPEKTLLDRVAERSFEPRRHRRLLDGALVELSELRELQLAYQRADTEAEKRRIAHEFERQMHRLPTPTLLERVRAMSFEQFCERILHLQLADFQREFTQEFARLHSDGRRVYRLALLLVPRGGGKTMLSSAIALHELLRREDAPSVLLAASTRDQAARAFEYIGKWIRGSEELRAAVTMTKTDLTVPLTHGKLRVLSSIGESAYGETPSVVVADELHVWRSDSHRTLWDALVSGLGKRPDSFLVGITTVPDGSESLLAGLLDAELHKPMLEQRSDCLRVVRDEDGAILTWFYGAPEDCDIDDEQVWSDCNPQPWTTLHDLRFEHGVLSPSAFSRLILNRPAIDEDDALVPRAMWERCRSSTPIELRSGAQVFAGLEASFGRQTMAAALAARLDGRIAVWCRTWSMNDETPASVRVAGERVDHEELAVWLDWASGSFDLQAVAFDPSVIRLEPERLRQQGYVVEAIASGSERAREASRRLFALIDSEILVHDADEALTAQILNTRGQLDQHERLGVFKRKQTMKIDGWYACANAVALLDDLETTDVLFDWTAFFATRGIAIDNERSDNRVIGAGDAHAMTNPYPGPYSPLSRW
jgi:phage terminase large subunit-like protein